MRLASSSGRIRKSPRNHHVVGECIRNPALRLLPLELSTFPQAIVKKEKEPKRKKTATTVPLTLSLKLPESNYKGSGLLETFGLFFTAFPKEASRYFLDVASNPANYFRRYTDRPLSSVFSA